MRYALSCVICLLIAVSTFAQIEERNQAIIHYQAGEYNKAILLLEELRLGKHADHSSLLHLAASYYKTGNRPQAVTVLQELDTAAAVMGKFEYQKEVNVLKRPHAKCGEERSGPKTVKLLVEYGADGKMGFVLPFSDEMSSFMKNALAAAQATEFESARVNNKNVPALRVMQYDCRYF